MKRGTEGVHDEVLDLQLIKPAQVAKMLAVSVPKVYQLAAAGELPSIRLGNSVRFDPADVVAYIRARRRDVKR